MSLATYEQHDGLGLAELVRRKEVSPAELLEAAITRAEKHNPKLNAIVHKAYDLARAEAAKGSLPAGPFQGVPFLIKDLGLEVAGMNRTDGTFFKDDAPDAHDALLTKRFRQAGVVIFGKTNTPEFGITGTTESARLKPCRNPWNTEHITGGSSSATHTSSSRLARPTTVTSVTPSSAITRWAAATWGAPPSTTTSCGG